MPLEKRFMILNERTKVTLGLLVLIALTSAAAITPLANANEAALTISPNRGPTGTVVNIIGMGFASNTQASISIGGNEVASAYVSSMFGRISTSFAVPSSMTPDVYLISATDAQGNSATASFTVTAKTPTPTATAKPPATQAVPTPTSPITPTSPKATTWLYPYQPTPSPAEAASSGFWSPLTIGVIVAALAASTITITFALSRRGRQKPLLDEERPPYKPGPSTPPRTPVATTRYDQPSYYRQQPSKPGLSTRYSQTPRYGQQFSKPAAYPRYGQPPTRSPSSPFTKVCPRCKRAVRDDYNICPYCDKRLR